MERILIVSDNETEREAVDDAVATFSLGTLEASLIKTPQKAMRVVDSCPDKISGVIIAPCFLKFCINEFIVLREKCSANKIPLVACVSLEDEVVDYTILLLSRYKIKYVFNKDGPRNWEQALLELDKIKESLLEN